MPIVDTWIGLDNMQADGKRHVHEYRKDHTGKIQRRVMHDVPASDDVLALAQARIPYWDAKLLTDEAERVEMEVEEGADPATIKRDHITARQAVKPLVKVFMRMPAGPKTVRVAEFIRDYVTDAILDADLSLTIRQRIKVRVMDLITMKADLLADDSKREEIE
jgi:hypothetical protein